MNGIVHFHPENQEGEVIETDIVKDTDHLDIVAAGVEVEAGVCEGIGHLIMEGLQAEK